MNPEPLLTILVQAHRQLSADPGTPFLLQRTEPALPILSHPMLPEGGFSVDADIHNALHMLVQWGYLAQPEQYHDLGYVFTPAGLSYAARRDGTWDGTERRQDDRRSDRQRVSGVVEPRGADNRKVERRAS